LRRLSEVTIREFEQAKNGNRIFMARLARRGAYEKNPVKLLRIHFATRQM